MEELLTLQESHSEEEPEDDPDRWKVKSQPLSEYFESLSKGKASEDDSEEEEQVEEVLEAEEDMEMTEEKPGWDVADESEVIDYIEDTFYPDTPREEEILVAEETKKRRNEQKANRYYLRFSVKQTRIIMPKCVCALFRRMTQSIP